MTIELQAEHAVFSRP